MTNPVPPTGPQDYARLERYTVGPEPVDLIEHDRPRSGWIFAWALAFLLIWAVAFLVANRSAAPRSAPDPSVPVAPDPRPSGAPLSLPGSDPAGLRGDGGSSPQAVQGGAPNTLDPRVGREGTITHMGEGGWPVAYLAIPLGPGHRVRICGPAACRVMVSTDAGPSRERILAGVIADVSWQRFETLCGVPARMGRCPGSWMVVTGDQTLPPTDVTP